MLGAERAGHLVPPGEGLGLGVPREDGADHGGDRGALLGGRVAREVAGPVHPAAPEAGGEDAPGGGPQALVVVGDDSLGLWSMLGDEGQAAACSSVA